MHITLFSHDFSQIQVILSLYVLQAYCRCENLCHLHFTLGVKRIVQTVTTKFNLLGLFQVSAICH